MKKVINWISGLLKDEKGTPSSKRFVGFASFFMLICCWGADTFTAFEVKDKILECFMYITVVGLGVTAAEKFGKK